jgi:hypothetical protein
MICTVRILIVSLLFSTAAAQTPAVENALFWKIEGNGLTQPSYLFGTYHLLGSRYADSLTNVMSRFHTCRSVVGEIVYDSTLAFRLINAARMKGTTLDKLLSPAIYNQTAAWLKELSGYELQYFNSFNPMTVQLLLATHLQQKYYPLNSATEIPLDLYFQSLAHQNQRPVAGLETFEDQVHALYDQFSYERQAELLTQFILDKDKALQETVILLDQYRHQNLAQMEKALDSQDYTPAELQVLVTDRNKKWATELPGMLRDGSAFIAVGALHLAGPNGLVTLLRNAGYTVTPLPLR